MAGEGVEQAERGDGAAPGGRNEWGARAGRELRIKVRGLRRGDSGEAVRRLQERLAAMGYEPGPPDGIFGFLTEDALREFQRDFRLKIDGVAGPQVWKALHADLPRRRRIVHVVQSGERLPEIAGRYGVSVPALRWMNGLHGNKRLEHGARLVIRSSYVLAAAAPGASARVLSRTLLTQRRSATALAVPPLLAGADGQPQSGDPGELAGFELLVREGGWTGYIAVTGAAEPLGEIACRRKASKRLLDAIAGAVDRVHKIGEGGPAGEAARVGGAAPLSGGGPVDAWGLYLDLGLVPLGRGGRLAAWVASLLDRVGARPLVLGLDIPPGGWKAFVADPDYELLGRVAHRVVAGAHRWEALLDDRGRPPSRERLERLVAGMARLVPPWKLLLGVPFDAWAIARDGSGEPVSYRTAVIEGYTRGVRARKEAGGYMTLDFPEECGSRYARIVAPSRDVIERYVALAHRFRLDGLFLSGVGEEDRRFWELLSQRIKAAQGE